MAKAVMAMTALGAKVKLRDTDRWFQLTLAWNRFLSRFTKRAILPEGGASGRASSTHTRRYLTARLRHQPHEVFAVLFLDTRHRVIAYEELFHGTIDGTSVHPRQVVKRALHHNAAALILAHNHPSGVAEPSRADESITLRLKEALALIDVRVIDHFVIGDGQSVSFAERGLL